MNDTNTNAPTETKAVVAEYDLPQSPAKVWRALTEPALLAKWLGENDLRPVVGHAFTFRMPPVQGWDGIIRCEILAAEPEKRLRYSWCGGPSGLQIDSVVTWTLTPTASGGTRLALEHAGFLPNNPFAYKGAKFGWTKMVGALAALVIE